MNLKDIRTVTSPSSGVGSPNINRDITESVVVSRNAGFGIEPTKLDFKTSKVESKFTNISMIQSQVMNNSTAGNGFFSNPSSSTVIDRFAPTYNRGSDRNIDPMK